MNVPGGAFVMQCTASDRDTRTTQWVVVDVVQPVTRWTNLAPPDGGSVSGPCEVSAGDQFTMSNHTGVVSVVHAVEAPGKYDARSLRRAMLVKSIDRLHKRYDAEAQKISNLRQEIETCNQKIEEIAAGLPEITRQGIVLEGQLAQIDKFESDEDEVAHLFADAVKTGGDVESIKKMLIDRGLLSRL